MDCHLHCASHGGPAQWRSAGVTGGIVASVTAADWENVLQCCAGESDIFLPALGIHPWHAAEADAGTLEALEAVLRSNGQALVGETGLDYVPSVQMPHAIQEEAFLRQAELAVKYDRPAILHFRGRWDRTLEMLGQVGPLRGVIHCFSGSAEVAERIIRETALDISIGPSILKPEAGKLRRAVSILPLERIFTDSDYPYQNLTPPECGRIVCAVAAIRNITYEECADRIAENWRRLIRTGS